MKIGRKLWLWALIAGLALTLLVRYQKHRHSDQQAPATQPVASEASAPQELKHATDTLPDMKVTPVAEAPVPTVAPAEVGVIIKNQTGGFAFAASTSSNLPVQFVSEDTIRRFQQQGKIAVQGQAQ